MSKRKVQKKLTVSDVYKELNTVKLQQQDLREVMVNMKNKNTPTLDLTIVKSETAASVDSNKAKPDDSKKDQDNAN